jgi:hypothetical protein
MKSRTEAALLLLLLMQLWLLVLLLLLEFAAWMHSTADTRTHEDHTNRSHQPQQWCMLPHFNELEYLTLHTNIPQYVIV